MGLFDVVKEKAAELLSGAGDKVSELTGTELPNAEAAADQVSQATDTVSESVQGATDAATETATGAVDGAVDGATGAVSDTIDPYRP